MLQCRYSCGTCCRIEVVLFLLLGGLLVDTASYETESNLSLESNFENRFKLIKIGGNVRFYNITYQEDNIETVNIKERPSVDYEQDEDWYIGRVFLQLLVLICGTAGVLLICCVCCAQIVTRVIMRREIARQRRSQYSFNQIQRDHNTIFEFPAMHRHPWSPAGGFTVAENTFMYDENNDKPPSYDELTSQEETLCSPPPPYTPSYHVVNNDLSNDCNVQIQDGNITS